LVTGQLGHFKLLETAKNRMHDGSSVRSNDPQ
jgi:hypothetical protein